MPNPFKYGSIEFDNWNYEHPDEARYSTDAVTLAKDSLGRADEFADQTGSADIAALEDRLAKLRSPEDKRGIVRRITEPLARAGGIAQAASLPASINPVIGGALGAGGTLATVPDLLRRYLAPEEGEEAPGLVEGGLTAAAVLPSVRGLRSLAATKPFIGPLGDLEGAAGIGGRALAYEGGAAPILRPTTRTAPAAIEQLLASPSFENLPRGEVSMARPRPGVPQGAQTFADAVREAAATLKQHMIPEQGATTFADAARQEASHPFRSMQRTGAFGGDRTVRGIGGLEQGGPSGLSSLGSLKKNALPSVELPIPSVEELDPMARLAARSTERFGKRYRKE